MRRALPLFLRRDSSVACTDAACLDGRSLAAEFRSGGGPVTAVGLQDQSGSTSWFPVVPAKRIAGLRFQTRIPLDSVLARPGERHRMVALLSGGSSKPVGHELGPVVEDAAFIFAPHPQTGQHVSVYRSERGAAGVVANAPAPVAEAGRVDVYLDRIEVAVLLSPEGAPAQLMRLTPVETSQPTITIAARREDSVFVLNPGHFGQVSSSGLFRLAAVVESGLRTVGRSMGSVIPSHAFVYPPVEGRTTQGSRLQVRIRFDRSGNLRLRVLLLPEGE